MNKDVINLCYYFSCKIFALDHWRVEISTHWPREINMADVKHCTASPINDFEGFLHMFYCRIKHFTESLTEKHYLKYGFGRVKLMISNKIGFGWTLYMVKR
jgi:hypothetical protein